MFDHPPSQIYSIHSKNPLNFHVIPEETTEKIQNSQKSHLQFIINAKTERIRGRKTCRRGKNRNMYIQQTHQNIFHTTTIKENLIQIKLFLSIFHSVL